MVVDEELEVEMEFNLIGKNTTEVIQKNVSLYHSRNIEWLRRGRKG